MSADRSRAAPRALLLAVCVGATALAACGSAHHRAGTGGHSPAAEGIPAALIAESRPIGRGPRFTPPVSGRPVGPCRPDLGARMGVHVEVFAADRVVLVAAGIGAEPPFRYSGGRIVGARCFGALVTTDPTGLVLARPGARLTGLVLARPGARLTLSALFDSWGQPLSSTRVASFVAPPGRRVAVFVDGRPWAGTPQNVPLARHSEIVLEVGPYVPPHSAYAFPPGT